MKTYHKPDCKRVFKNYDMSCPRCLELASGSSPRKSWGSSRLQQDQKQLAAIRAHFAPNSPHSRGTCGPICTFGDY